jgi:hypothetical protein
VILGARHGTTVAFLVDSLRMSTAVSQSRFVSGDYSVWICRLKARPCLKNDPRQVTAGF